MRVSQARLRLFASASYVAFYLSIGAADAQAQTAPSQGGASSLPAVTVDPPETRRRPASPAARSSTSAGRTRRPQAARRNETAPAASPPPAASFGPSQDARTGTVGVYANSTSVATKTNTPLIDIPQSVSVVTKEFIQDQGFQTLTDVTRYVPGVAIHQGEGNRDELVIRGVDSSANFYVNGFRDDVQYFRDLYNAQSVEVLKGPSALTFGRGAGGGLVNRTLKEADGTRIYQAAAQTGSYNDRRVSLDAGQAVNENVAVRLNTFYENSDTFRDYGHFERYGFNPTVTLKPTDDTKIKLSYEYYHDERLADRGNPSLGIPGGATRFNPTVPFAPNGDLTTFYGSPIYNQARVDVQTGIAVIEHDFGNGLTAKNSTLYADYNRGYRNVYPGGTGGGPGGGAVTPDLTQVSLNAYQNDTPRENVFNQTDFIYKTATGPVFHTVAFGTEFGRETGLSRRDSGIFPNNGNRAFDVVNPFNPTYFGPVLFTHLPSDANSKYRLNIASGYVQDQIEATRWLQFFLGARYDSFDLSAFDFNTNINRSRVDEKVSPRVAVIVKPIDNLSVYTAYSTSFLPASGDQFSALSPGTLILQPQKFENTEVGVKWNIQPKLLFTAALYELNRTNVPIADPNNPGFFFANGANQIRGFETAVTGYITPDWQTVFGYAYTDARVTSATSPTIVPGNRVQLVPFNQFAWWIKYQIDQRWAASLGIIYFSDSFASSDDTVRLPGFWRFDAGLFAKIDETWSAQLNVENIFNTGYWATADGNNNISPGQGRTFRVLARARF
ncbi:TonB-dependent siderophore receptor [Bradyrhizobium sp. Leo121]|uniref:TonB-dependent receptor n=1 Tax=Bradyrhizobium sp. Leo121 TaxID=1571195 RepID=UPI00102A1CD7|nr:TonB-dependent siderophore receptor [Bradyrhizobium sp. Leo121]RZN31383.1 TonB-dependent siderophore receptor [Bradyrhizobium sp. Leo121]